MVVTLYNRFSYTEIKSYYFKDRAKGEEYLQYLETQRNYRYAFVYATVVRKAA